MSEQLIATQVNMIRRLKFVRDKSVFSSFAWNGMSFDCDAVSQPRILGMLVAAQAGALPASLPWRLADNSWATITPGDVSGIFAAMQAHIQTKFAIFAEHEANINAMTDPDDVVAYNVEVF
jgi:hypothetical protein